MRGKIFYSLIALGMFLLASCNNDDEPQKKKISDTINSGEITIAVDDNYADVMAQQMKVFDSSFPDARITVNYLPQEIAMEQFFKDSARMVIAARSLTDQEKAYIKENNINIRSLSMAIDAVAVIINPEAQDSFLNLVMLQSILKNTFARQYDIVFDHQKSGVVKYIKDKLIPDNNFPSNSYALQTTDSVIAYVAKNKNAMGFVPVSKLYDKSDESQLGTFIANVKLVALESDSLNEFFLPYQPNLFANHYPLTRPLFFHLKERHRGLGTGLANFLCHDRGQTLFYRDRMLPTRIPIAYSRETILK